MPLLLLLLLAVLALCPAAQGQSVAWYNDNVLQNRGNAFPFGSDGIRYQCIVPASVLGNKPVFIQDIFLAGRSLDVEIVYGDIEVMMGYTSVAAPAANWSTNNPNPVRVYRGPLRVRLQIQKWLPMGLPGNFLWLPKPGQNLCIEVIVWNVIEKGGYSTNDNFYFPECGVNTTATPNGNIPRAYLYQWRQKGGYSSALPPGTSTSSGCKMGLLLDNGNIIFLGQGCKGSAGTPTLTAAAGTWPQLGKVFKVNLVGAAPASPALFTLGVSEARWSVLTLPFDLTPFGATNCFIWNDALLMKVLVTSNNGDVVMPLGIPNDPVLMGATLYTGWLNLDTKANPLGLTTSSYARMILGS